MSQIDINLVEDYETATDTMQSLLVGRYYPITLNGFKLPQELIQSLSGSAKGLFERIGNHQLVARRCLTEIKFPSKINPKIQWMLHWELDSYSVLVRSAFECLLTLEHIYLNSPSVDELLLRYNLWIFSQTRAYCKAIAKVDPSLVTSAENEVSKMLKATQSLPIYLTLDTKSQAIIDGMKDYKKKAFWMYYIDNNSLELVDGSWKGISKRLSPSLENVYGLLSEMAHPTLMSTYIINGDKRPKLHFQPNIHIALGLLVCSLSIRAACLCYTDVAAKFKELPAQNQELINKQLKHWLGDGSEL
ncbi:hypothetical protein GCM10028806_00850 [Spirosoma terrae]|uniref:Uncharacterized protein n=1 Tax=Spirosoma terrae TaxID=1968276 RepID=A0A6L9LFK2_9BACT|nr:hypothetical protein [Spirosoma terrae]NDU97653.1 hypothetical protein [Spirosoma terrae]